ncbi:unannotated protein [freshwater metagenome]|uniref:Unannotated protein n=1 Tax=freshwater metagenome TaxID=449393 RepID=A0A6J7CA71_9ZZZZ
MLFAHRFQPPGAGVGNVDSHSAQHRFDIRRIAQVDARRHGEVAQHLGVSSCAPGGGVGLIRWAWADQRSDDSFGDINVHRKSIGGHFGAQQFGGGFRTCHRLGITSDSAITSESGQQVRLERLGSECRRRPLCGVGGGVAPPALDPFRPQIAVGPDGLVGVSVVAASAEQIELARDRSAVVVEIV